MSERGAVGREPFEYVLGLVRDELLAHYGYQPCGWSWRKEFAYAVEVERRIPDHWLDALAGQPVPKIDRYTPYGLLMLEGEVREQAQAWVEAALTRHGWTPEEFYAAWRKRKQ